MRAADRRREGTTEEGLRLHSSCRRADSLYGLETGKGRPEKGRAASPQPAAAPRRLPRHHAGSRCVWLLCVYRKETKTIGSKGSDREGCQTREETQRDTQVRWDDGEGSSEGKGDQGEGEGCIVRCEASASQQNAGCTEKKGKPKRERATRKMMNREEKTRKLRKEKG
jgi:hypothetical protein